MSTPQVLPTGIVFDYLTNGQGQAMAYQRVDCVLNYNSASTTSPVTTQIPFQASTFTDSNGYYQFSLVPNASLNPTGTTYRIKTSSYNVQVSVPGTGTYQVPSILVTSPATLNPAGQTVGALTVTGLLTAQDGVHVAAGGIQNVGGETTDTLDVTGNETVGGTLDVTGAATLASTLGVTGALTVDGGGVIQQPTATSLALQVQALAAAIGTQFLLEVISHTGAATFAVNDEGDVQASGTFRADGQITGLAGLQITGATTIVGDTVLDGLTTFEGHLASTLTGTPTLSNENAAFTYAITGNDTRGTIVCTFVSGSVTAAGRFCTVTFAAAYATAPIVLLQYVGTTGTVYGSLDTASGGTTSFDVINGATAQSSTFSIQYFVIG